MPACSRNRRIAKMKIFVTKLIFSIIVLGLAVPVLEASEQAQQTADKDPNTIQSVKTIHQEIRQADLSTLPEADNSEMKQKLQKLIEKLSMLEPPKPAIMTSQDTETGKTETQTQEKDQPDADKSTSQDSEPVKTHTDKEQMLANLAARPQRVVNPLAAGETLFAEKHLDEAAEFYKLVLQRTTDEKDAPDRSWAMFQLANCIRHIKPDEAFNIYNQLITEYPNSQWTPAAQIQQMIITWNKQNNPQSVLKRYRSDPNSI